MREKMALEAAVSKACAAGAKVALAEAEAFGGASPSKEAKVAIARLRDASAAAEASLAAREIAAAEAAAKEIEQRALAAGAAAEYSAFEAHAAVARAAASEGNVCSRALDALFVVAQHDTCAFAGELLAANVGSLCHAARRESVLWGALTRAETTQRKRRTRLMFAASKGDAARVEFLLKANPRAEHVNARSGEIKMEIPSAGLASKVVGSALLCAAGAIVSCDPPRVAAVLRLLLDAGGLETTPVGYGSYGSVVYHIYTTGSVFRDSPASGQLRSFLATADMCQVKGASLLRQMVEKHVELKVRAP